MTPTQYTQSPGRAALERDPVRLRDAKETMERNPIDGSSQWAVSLLREAAPYQSALGRKERIWLALPAMRFARQARLRFAFAACALAVSGLFTSAALAQWPAWLANAIESIVASSPKEALTAPAQEIARTRHSTPSEPPAAPGVSPPAPETALAPPSPARTEMPQSSHPRRAAKAASPEDLQPLIDAIRALRVDRNPVRARALLTAYLDRYPRGELAEEALVTLIQAAAAHHDSDVQMLAARYFKTYPRGTFRGSVEQALNASPEPARVPVKNQNE
jgi:hypothetical protein